MNSIQFPVMDPKTGWRRFFKNVLKCYQRIGNNHELRGEFSKYLRDEYALMDGGFGWYWKLPITCNIIGVMKIARCAKRRGYFIAFRDFFYHQVGDLRELPFYREVESIQSYLVTEQEVQVKGKTIHTQNVKMTRIIPNVITDTATIDAADLIQHGD